jgi:hypothetical protein
MKSFGDTFERGLVGVFAVKTPVPTDRDDE